MVAKKKEKKPLHPSFRPCRDYIIAMVPLLALASYLYGKRPLLLCAVAVVTAVLCDGLVSLLRRMPPDLTDLSGPMFALMFTLMLPASARYETAALGVAFTVLLGKHAFGGYEQYPFHPVAFGFAFASACWPEELYHYPRAFSAIGIGADSGANVYAGVAEAMRYGGVPSTSKTDLILGSYPGPMGATFCLVILACMVLFVVHRTISWRIVFSYLATCAVWAFLFPRIQATRFESVLYEMLTGAIIFCAVFIVPEPSVTPVSPLAKYLFGGVYGILTMMFRTFGPYEMGVCFAALLIGPLAPAFERLVQPGGTLARVSLSWKGGSRK